MSANPALLAPSHSSIENASRGSMTSGSIALIVNTRDYVPLTLIRSLVHFGFTSAERPTSETLTFVEHLRPGLVVGIVDPTRPQDVQIIRTAARFGAYVVVLAPDFEGFSACLDAGADVCLSDEAAETALEAQIGAIRRRLAWAPPAESEVELSVGDFQLDRRSQRMFYKGSIQVPVTTMEFSILAYLVENAGNIVSAVELFHHITGRLERGTEASESVKVHIHRIRQKLQSRGAVSDMITTVRGHGYMIERRTPAN